jgi:membrane-bound ClpP family serine protease
MSPLFWVTTLLFVGLFVMVLEVFIPSGGLLGFVSIAAIVAAIATAFAEQGIGPGFLVLAITAVAVPATLALAFHLFPSTPLGRRIMPSPPEPQDLVPDQKQRDRLRGLVGSQGRAVTDLVPWGQVEVSNERIEAVSRAGPISNETVIEVVGTEGRAVVVRTTEIKPELRAYLEPPEDAHSDHSLPEKSEERPISSVKTFEDLTFDDFEDSSGA